MSPPPQPAAGEAVPGLSVSFTTEVLVGTFIVFFFLFVFFLIHFLHKNSYLGAIPVLESSPPRFLLTSLPRRALDPNVLKSLPVSVFSSVDFKDAIECAVCFSELADGEAVRMLPGCRHGFHLECIDMWFDSNSTCPICRSSVDSKNVILGDLEQSLDESGEGSSSSVSSGSRKPAGILTIDVETGKF